MKIKRGFIPWGSGKEGGFFSGPRSYSGRNCEYLPCCGWMGCTVWGGGNSLWEIDGPAL